MGVRDDVPYCTLFPFFVFTFLPIKLEIARSEMYHYRICVHRGARLEGVGDLSATDVGLWGNKACMRSCFPPLNGVSMSLGPRVACRLSEVVDLAWPSCIISLLNHVGCVSRWLTSSTFTYTCSSLFCLFQANKEKVVSFQLKAFVPVFLFCCFQVQLRSSLSFQLSLFFREPSI